jgi:hypothetical protein
MDTRRSYYLAHREDEFGKAPADAGKLYAHEILYAAPANDNSLSKTSLSVRCRTFLQRLLSKA